MLDLLQGIRIISFNHFLLGPMGIQALADLGADVIAVETPEGRGSATGAAAISGTTGREWCIRAPTATSAASRSI
jgi:crotonobetainyl-CoA:carnitine CoA-transferase CaiB-like acyl-CoA transferase